MGVVKKTAALPPSTNVAPHEAVAKAAKPFLQLTNALMKTLLAAKGAVVSQSALRLRLLLGDIADSIGDLCKSFDAHVKAHYEAGGDFEGGKVAITFPSTAPACRPKWKEEAVRLAKELAALRGDVFDEVGFLNQIKEAYPATGEPTTSVKLTVSA